MLIAPIHSAIQKKKNDSAMQAFADTIRVTIQPILDKKCKNGASFYTTNGIEVQTQASI